jgi:hypothetical protein
MHRGKILLVLLAAMILAPDSADARRRSVGRTVIETVAMPFRIVGQAVAPRRFGMKTWYFRKAKYARGPRRAVIVRRPAPVVVPGAAGAAAAAAGATAAVAGGETSSGSQVAATQPTTQLPGPTPGRSQVRLPAPPQAAAPSGQQGTAAMPSASQAPAATGWRGPLYWPYASDDLFDTAFQPASADWFWSRGGGDLIDAIVMRGDDRTGGWSDMCGSRRGGSAVWIEPIEQALDPTDAQRRALDELRDALVHASNAVKIACPATDTAANPVQRLQAMTDRLWTLRHAITTIRAPLEKLTNSLSEAQRVSFNAIASSPRDTTASVSTGPGGAARACADPSVMASWPGDQIEARVHPSTAQREALRTLQLTTLGMAQFLMGSCPGETPRTPLARLDAAEKRLNALLYAVRNLSPAVAGFYGTLTHEQKLAFHALGRDAPRTGPGAAQGGMRGGAGNQPERGER